MSTPSYIDNDIATVWHDPSGGRQKENLVAVLYRGDRIEVVEKKDGNTLVRLGTSRVGWVRQNLRLRDTGLLEFAFIDVGQGDACLITTPNRYRVLVDGGENKLAARYLAARYWDETNSGNDVLFDAVVVTHGDADHFAGLSILALDAAEDERDRKRISFATRRIFHNGLVKRSSNVSDREQLGVPVLHENKDFVPVVDDPRVISDANEP
ncbi:MAG: hypothetical protein EOP06_21280, partial [Proteobacteria bacterium]